MGTLLPVVRRELRIASRRKTTFVVRFVGAVAAVLLGGVFLLPALLPGVSGTSGGILLHVLATLALALALFAGPLLTADCISRERREGTLGFLFLTDLNGLDVVGGKFAALSLTPLHALLATLPVAALTVCLGGVTGAEFWRVQLVLLNTLFLSLALGIWVSSLVTDDRQAVGTALALITALVSIPWLLGAAASALGPQSPWTRVGLAGPVMLYQAAYDKTYATVGTAFFWGLLLQHVMAWSFLGTAALIVRHSWKEGGHAGSPQPVAPAARAPRAPQTWTAARGTDAWKDGPLAWYAWQNSWARRGAWWIAIGGVVVALVAAGILGVTDGRASAAVRTGQILSTACYLLKLFVAIHAVYFLYDACRTGAMELLLATPITSRSLFQGHFAAMRRLFLAPYLTLAIVQVLMAVAARWVDGGDWPSLAARVLSAGIPATFAAGLHGLDLVAVAFYASRWALHYDRPAKALLRTAVLLLLMPAMFCSAGRIFVDLFVILQTRPMLENFRDLVRGWYFPGVLGVGYGSPRVG